MLKGLVLYIARHRSQGRGGRLWDIPAVPNPNTERQLLRSAAIRRSFFDLKTPLGCWLIR
jgi:hypothetical protein